MTVTSNDNDLRNTQEEEKHDKFLQVDGDNTCYSDTISLKSVDSDISFATSRLSLKMGTSSDYCEDTLLSLNKTVRIPNSPQADLCFEQDSELSYDSERDEWEAEENHSCSLSNVLSEEDDEEYRDNNIKTTNKDYQVDEGYDTNGLIGCHEWENDCNGLTNLSSSSRQQHQKQRLSSSRLTSTHISLRHHVYILVIMPLDKIFELVRVRIPSSPISTVGHLLALIPRQCTDTRLAAQDHIGLCRLYGKGNCDGVREKYDNEGGRDLLAEGGMSMRIHPISGKGSDMSACFEDSETLVAVPFGHQVHEVRRIGRHILDDPKVSKLVTKKSVGSRLRSKKHGGSASPRILPSTVQEEEEEERTDLNLSFVASKNYRRHYNEQKEDHPDITAANQSDPSTNADLAARRVYAKKIRVSDMKEVTGQLPSLLAQQNKSNPSSCSLTSVEEKEKAEGQEKREFDGIITLSATLSNFLPSPANLDIYRGIANKKLRKFTSRLRNQLHLFKAEPGMVVTKVSAATVGMFLLAASMCGSGNIVSIVNMENVMPNMSASIVDQGAQILMGAGNAGLDSASPLGLIGLFKVGFWLILLSKTQEGLGNFRKKQKRTHKEGKKRRNKRKSLRHQSNEEGGGDSNKENDVSQKSVNSHRSSSAAKLSSSGFNKTVTFAEDVSAGSKSKSHTKKPQRQRQRKLVSPSDSPLYQSYKAPIRI